MHRTTRLPALMAALFLGALLLSGQGPRVTDALRNIDLAGLKPAQQAVIYKILTTRQCSCGCGMTIADCRLKDLTCYYSRGLANTIVESIRAGKSEAEAVEAADASVYAHIPVNDGRPLSDPIKIPVAGAPSTGPANAPITLVEFSDFECPYCILAAPEIDKMLKAYPGQVSLVFKQFPLEMHSSAAVAAAASVAADKQGRFWPMYEAIFAQRGHLSRDVILGLARALGLDMKRFESDMNSKATMATLARDEEDGYNAGVMGTPTVFVNGRRFNLALKLDSMKPVIEAELAKLNAKRPVGKKPL